MKINKTAHIILMLMIILLSTNAFGQTKKISNEEKIKFGKMVDSYITSYPDYKKFNGAIFVSVGDKPFFNKEYGFASMEHKIPVKRNTKFAVGSFTKIFTAILTLKMKELGLIDLDKTISDYLDYYPKETGNKITLKHLLSHTSGIPHHMNAISTYFDIQDNYYHTPKELISQFSSTPLVSDPGKEFVYSSPGYYIIATILEKVTRKSYAELIKEYILNPLGMKNSSISNNRTILDNMADGYSRGLNGLVRAEYEDYSTALGAGGLVTTAEDLFAFRKSMTKKTDAILNEESKKLLYNFNLKDMPATWGGQFYELPNEKSKTPLQIIGLSGSSSGFSAAMYRCIDPDCCIIVLSNIEDLETQTIIDDIGDFLTRDIFKIPVGRPAPKSAVFSETPKKIPLEVTNRYLGFYGKSGRNISGIFKIDGKIYQIQYSKGGQSSMATELTPLDSSEFQNGNMSFFHCKFEINAGNLTKTNIINGRKSNPAPKMMSAVIDNNAEYEGDYSSVELQKSFRITNNSGKLVLLNFQGEMSIELFPLEKDLFGFSNGFIDFSRAKDGTINSYKIITKNTDTYFGSKFVKI